LTSQEIRACIYYGDFNETLSLLAEDPAWRNVFGVPNTRLKEEELILRFFALFFQYEQYTKPLKIFLNSFMESNRNHEKYSRSELMKLFKNTIHFVNGCLGQKAFRVGGGINAAVFDSIMVGTAKRLQRGKIESEKQFVESYLQLIESPDFLQVIKGGTSDDLYLKSRITMAIEIFDNLN
jgi:hypothetical protein